MNIITAKRHKVLWSKSAIFLLKLNFIKQINDAFCIFPLELELLEYSSGIFFSRNGIFPHNVVHDTIEFN